MAIKAMPVTSDRIFLGDLLNNDYPDTPRGRTIKQISERVAVLEGDCDPGDRAWVMIRQATEADNMHRADRVSKRTVRWKGEDVEETRDDNLREQWALEVYMCLVDTGNLYDIKDKPLFTFKDTTAGYRKLAMGFQDFLNAYGTLPTAVILAIRRAVLETNPDWDYWFEGTESEEESGEA